MFYLYHIALRVLWLIMPAGFGIVAEHNVPETLPIGEEVAVNWALHKGEVSGFAKLTLDVPPLLRVEARNANGASFSFENNQAKFIWMDMPSTPTLAVGLNLIAQPGFEGGSIRPIFSFIRDGDRVDLDLDPATVRPDAKTQPLGFAQYNVTRTVAFESDQEAVVTLNVASEPTVGFLKIEEFLPTRCTAEVLDAHGATSSQLDETFKLIWFEAPQEKDFAVRYRLSCERSLRNNADWEGQIAFVSNDRPITRPITSAPPSVNAEDANSDLTMSTEPTPTPTPTPSFVDFRVQVMAAHRYVDGNWVRNRFGFEEDIDVEEQDDWYKYTTGTAAEYAAARDQREALKAYNFPGPFVTAYLRGERISVQEALALSSQEWIP